MFGRINPETGIVLTSKAYRGNTISFFSFLLQVVKTYGNRKVVMVLDNVPYHHAKRLKPILERYKHRIELVYLPPYSPDLNPIERVWWYRRKKITHNRYVQDMDDQLRKFDLFISAPGKSLLTKKDSDAGFVSVPHLPCRVDKSRRMPRSLS